MTWRLYLRPGDETYMRKLSRSLEIVYEDGFERGIRVLREFLGCVTSP